MVPSYTDRDVAHQRALVQQVAQAVAGDVILKGIKGDVLPAVGQVEPRHLGLGARLAQDAVLASNG